MNEKQKWAIVSIYAAAMAWVEAAVVFYLRTMIDRIEPYQPDPLPNFVGLGDIEIVREAATLVMLFAVGYLAGSSRRTRLSYFAIAFGIWDIFYYAYLILMGGWPHSIFDWDILFLLPLPWWGPILAPVSIALLMIVGGTIATLSDVTPRENSWLVAHVGAIIALYTFMADAIAAAPLGAQAIRAILPSQFNWNLFIVGLAMMATPVLDMVACNLALKPSQGSEILH